MIQLYTATIMLDFVDTVHIVARTKELREQAIKEVLHRYGEKDSPSTVSRSFSTKKVVIIGADT